jgi:ribosomal-protein-alanine N-acetyltransferase
VRADNHSALRLYDSYGFERVGMRRGYYGPGHDGVVMRKRLAT